MHQPENNIILFLFGKKIQEPNFTSSQNIKKKTEKKWRRTLRSYYVMRWSRDFLKKSLVNKFMLIYRPLLMIRLWPQIDTRLSICCEHSQWRGWGGGGGGGGAFQSPFRQGRFSRSNEPTLTRIWAFFVRNKVNCAAKTFPSLGAKLSHKIWNITQNKDLTQKMVSFMCAPR